MTNRFNTFADEMRSELRSTQESLERRREENAMQERHTEHLINRLVEMSERMDRKDEEMLVMETFDTNRSETISFLKGKFSDELGAPGRTQANSHGRGGRI